eukprot:jgi/Botrbrau1/17945/Bobra.50_1s0040.1
MPEVSRHLLVCVDDNEASEHAVKWVLEDLYRRGDELHLVHVVLVFGRYNFPAQDQIIDWKKNPYAYLQDGKQKQQVEEFMCKRFKPLLDMSGAKYCFDIVRNVLEHEGIGETVLRVARHWQVPAIVVGKYHKGFDKFVHGSLSSQLIRLSETPVIVMS